MKKAIQARMLILVVVAVVVCSLISSLIFAVYTQDQAESWLSKLTYSVAENYKVNGDATFLSKAAGGNRVTVISPEGVVLSDSEKSPRQMGNHSNREEVKNASADRVYIALHNSSTLGERFMYASIKADNGNIIRVAHLYPGLLSNITVQIPAILLAIGVALLLSLFLAERFTKKITEPLEAVVQSLAIGEYDGPPINQPTYYEVERIQMAATILLAERNTQKHLEQQKQDFFSNASHELRTPITSIAGFAELLNLDLLETDEEKQEVIRRIGAESKRMSELIDDILVISQLESRQDPDEDTVFDLEETVLEAVQSVTPIKDDDKIEFDLSTEPLLVQANQKQIYELCVNLLGNAVKYNKPNGSVKVQLKRDDGNAVLLVEDTGIGIPREFQSRVFERFFRVDYGRDKKVGGSGLGLSIVKHIVSAYRGDISLQSTQGVGTTIRVSLPIVVR
jgi:two-component system phosphate regulon sensor histidine kinase PhoR